MLSETVSVSIFSFAILASMLFGQLVVASQPEIVDWRNQTTFHNARKEPISMIVLHHTVSPTAIATLNALNSQHISVHYIADRDGTIYYLVDELLRAWHAGTGIWAKFTDINSVSVGIEIVNSGAEPFPSVQVDAVAVLCRQIANRHKAIVPKNIVGHSDFAPTRKSDPSGYFDWRQFYSIMQIYSALFNSQLSPVEQSQVLLESSAQANSSVRELQQKLKKYGYNFKTSDIDGIFGLYTQLVVQAFNRHFCPEIYQKEVIVDGKTQFDSQNQRWYRLSQERLDYLNRPVIDG